MLLGRLHGTVVIMSTSEQRRPNVVWIFGDQHAAHAVSYRGNQNLLTPNIDDLARNGMRFDCAVAGAPWCCPFRASLLTGQYPHQHGVVKTPPTAPLDPGIPTIAAPFHDAGYHTAYVGKWHVDGGRPSHLVPPERRGGFDYWMGYENNNNQHEVFVHGSDSEEPLRLGGYETDSLTDLLLDHLARHVGSGGSDGDYQPFFASLSVQPPHDPYVAPHNPTYPHSRIRPSDVVLRPNVPAGEQHQRESRFAAAGYYAMVENLDYNLGRIRTRLKELGVDRETYLVFFSDHGDMLGSHGQWGKSSPWEEAIRVPFIIGTVGGKVHQAIGTTDAVINHVDIAPTTLGLCGIAVPDTMVGFDYADRCLQVNRPEYRQAPQVDSEPQSAFLQQIPGKYHAHTVNRPWRGVVTRDGWKYACQPGRAWLMHDLNHDPHEQANLAFDSAYQTDQERLHGLLGDWIASTGDAFELPDIGLPPDVPIPEPRF